MTLRNRLAAAAGVGVLIVVAGVSGVLYLFYADSLRARVDAALIDAAQQASAIAQQVKRSAGDKGPPNFAKPVTVGSSQVELFLGPVSAGQLTGEGPLDGRDVAVAEHAQTAYFTDVSAGDHRFRVYTAAMPDTSGGALVRTSHAGDADNAALGQAALLLAVLTVAAGALTYGLAHLTAGRVLRPIADLTAAAEHVTHTSDLTARLGVTGSDEVGRLGASFDLMLATLHEAITAQRQLVADASHELRTPLTSLTTNLELLDEGEGVADPQAPALVRAAREQAGELTDLVTGLLNLARYTESAPDREDVRLDLLTDAIVERRTERSPNAGIDAELQPCLVRVDPVAVTHAIDNLIDNALKWSPPGGRVRVAVGSGRLSVTDHGPGIADVDAPHIFERFYRAAAGRGMPGAGLGLAIVGQVARANGGFVHVNTGPAGSTFTLTFPPSELPRQPQETSVPVDAAAATRTARPEPALPAQPHSSIAAAQAGERYSRRARRTRSCE